MFTGVIEGTIGADLASRRLKVPVTVGGLANSPAAKATATASGHASLGGGAAEPVLVAPRLYNEGAKLVLELIVDSAAWTANDGGRLWIGYAVSSRK